MIKERRPQHRLRGFSPAAAALAGCMLAGTALQAAEPITIGFGMARFLDRPQGSRTIEPVVLRASRSRCAWPASLSG